MAHWANLDTNNKVLQVIVTDNNDPEEGYQWIMENLGGRWVKTSYNTIRGIHLLGGTPFRGNYACIGGEYVEDIDMFLPIKPFESWIPDPVKYDWKAPIPKPDSGLWEWDEETTSWKEID